MGIGGATGAATGVASVGTCTSVASHCEGAAIEPMVTVAGGLGRRVTCCGEARVGSGVRAIAAATGRGVADGSGRSHRSPPPTAPTVSSAAAAQARGRERRGTTAAVALTAHTGAE